ncbi:MAG: hypothetical protein JW986_07480 [Methanotrichaceae archaeon]|nr:hypothetical protein [Methanotrichaceae archaeon]
MISDWAIGLLIAEGIPFLALVYYLRHKRQMYLLEKGIFARDDVAIRAERRFINGLFLILAGGSMIMVPNAAKCLGLEMSLSFELLLASAIVLCAGIAMLAGGTLLRYKDGYSTKATGSSMTKTP